MMQEIPTTTKHRHQRCLQLRRILPETGYETLEVNYAVKEGETLRRKPQTLATMVIVRRMIGTVLLLLHLSAPSSSQKSGCQKFAPRLLLLHQDVGPLKTCQMTTLAVETTMMLQACLLVLLPPESRERGSRICLTDEIARVGRRYETIFLTMIRQEVNKKALEMPQILRTQSVIAADAFLVAGFK